MILRKKNPKRGLHFSTTFFRKSGSFAIACVFLTNVCLSDAVYAQNNLPSIPSSSSSIVQALPNDLTTIELPSGMVKLEDSFSGNSKNLVLLIQDAHAIPEAQRNIRNIIDYFSKSYALRTVALEGSDQNLTPQFFRSFPDKKILKDLFKTYLDQGELTGTTMAAIFNDIDIDYVGVENWQLFEQGYALYLQSQKNSTELLQNIHSEESKLNDLKKEVYTKEALSLDDVLTAFEDNQKSIVEVLTYLKTIETAPENSEIALIQKESEPLVKQDFPIEIEVKKLAQYVETGLKTKEASTLGGREVIASFNEKMQAFQLSQISPEEFAIILKELTSGLGLNIRLSKKLEQLMQNHKRLRDIEGTKFFDELQEYIKKVKEKVFTSEAEKRLDVKTQQLRILKKYSMLELSPQLWKDLKSKQGLWRSEDRDYLYLHEQMKTQFLFYENAEERDVAFIENLNQLFAKEKEKKTVSGDTKKMIALVSGGFHSHSLREKLRASETSFLLLTPVIQSLPEQIHYKQHMLGQVTWSSYFEVKDGLVNVADAFARYSRDQLLKDDQPDQHFLLKQWRDQILRDLAVQKKIEQAKNYTKYLDEIIKPSKQQNLLEEKIKDFGNSLRNLEDRGLLNQENVMNLLRPSLMTSSATYLALSNRWINLKPELSRSLSELRSLDASEIKADMPIEENQKKRAELRAKAEVGDQDKKPPKVRSDEQIRQAYEGFRGQRQGQIFDPDDKRTYQYDISALVKEIQQLEMGRAQESRILSFWIDSLRFAFEDLRQRDASIGRESDINLLEIGSGEGTLIAELSKRFRFYFQGIDFDETFVKVSNEKNLSQYEKQVRFDEGDATNLENISSGSKNIVIHNEGLGNLPLFQEQADAKAKDSKRDKSVFPVFQEVARVLKPGGFFVLNDYDEKDSEQITQLAGFLNYPIQARVKALEDAGFEIVKSEHLKTSLAQLPQTHTIIARKKETRAELRLQGMRSEVRITSAKVSEIKKRYEDKVKVLKKSVKKGFFKSLKATNSTFQYRYSQIFEETIQEVLEAHESIATGLRDQIAAYVLGSVARRNAPYGTDIDVFILVSQTNPPERKILGSIKSTLNEIIDIGVDFPVGTSDYSSKQGPMYSPSIDMLKKDLEALEGVSLRSLLDRRFIYGDAEINEELYSLLLSEEYYKNLFVWMALITDGDDSDSIYERYESDSNLISKAVSRVGDSEDIESEKRAKLQSIFEDKFEIRISEEQARMLIDERASVDDLFETESYIINHMEYLLEAQKGKSEDLFDFNPKKSPGGLRTIQLIGYLGRLLFEESENVYSFDYAQQSVTDLFDVLSLESEREFLSIQQVQKLKEAHQFFLDFRTALNLVLEKQKKAEKKDSLSKESMSAIADLFGISVEALNRDILINRQNVLNIAQDTVNYYWESHRSELRTGTLIEDAVSSFGNPQEQKEIENRFYSEIIASSDSLSGVVDSLEIQKVTEDLAGEDRVYTLDVDFVKDESKIRTIEVVKFLDSEIKEEVNAGFRMTLRINPQGEKNITLFRGRVIKGYAPETLRSLLFFLQKQNIQTVLLTWLSAGSANFFTQQLSRYGPTPNILGDEYLIDLNVYDFSVTNSGRSELRSNDNPYQPPLREIQTSEEIKRDESNIIRDWSAEGEATQAFSELLSTDEHESFFELQYWLEATDQFAFDLLGEGQDKSIYRILLPNNQEVRRLIIELSRELKRKDLSRLDSFMNVIPLSLVFVGPLTLIALNVIALSFGWIQNVRKTPPYMLLSYVPAHFGLYFVSRLLNRSNKKERVIPKSKELLTEIIKLSSSKENVDEEYDLLDESDSRSELRLGTDIELINLDKGQVSKPIVFESSENSNNRTIVYINYGNSQKSIGENPIMILRSEVNPDEFILRYDIAPKDVVSDKKTTREHEIDVSGASSEFTLGRSIQDGLDMRFSRNHATLSFTKMPDGKIELIVQDNGSTSKTRVGIETTKVAELKPTYKSKITDSAVAFWIGKGSKRTYVMVEKEGSEIVFNLYHYDGRSIVDFQIERRTFDQANPLFSIGRKSSADVSQYVQINRPYVSSLQGSLWIETGEDGKIKSLRILDGSSEKASLNGMYDHNDKKIGTAVGEAFTKALFKAKGVSLEARRIAIQFPASNAEEAVYQFAKIGLVLYFDAKSRSYFVLEKGTDPNEDLGHALIPGAMISVTNQVPFGVLGDLDNPRARIEVVADSVETSLQLNKDGSISFRSDDEPTTMLVLNQDVDMGYFPEAELATAILNEIKVAEKSYSENDIKEYVAKHPRVSAITDERARDAFVESLSQIVEKKYRPRQDALDAGKLPYYSEKIKEAIRDFDPREGSFNSLKEKLKVIEEQARQQISGKSLDSILAQIEQSKMLMKAREGDLVKFAEYHQEYLKHQLIYDAVLRFIRNESQRSRQSHKVIKKYKEAFEGFSAYHINRGEIFDIDRLVDDGSEIIEALEKKSNINEEILSLDIEDVKSVKDFFTNESARGQGGNQAIRVEVILELLKTVNDEKAPSALLDFQWRAELRSESSILFNDKNITERDSAVLSLQDLLDAEDKTFFDELYQSVYLQGKKYFYHRQGDDYDREMLGYGFQSDENQIFLTQFIDALFKNVNSDVKHKDKTRLLFLRAGAEPLVTIAKTMARVTGQFREDHIHDIWATMGMNRWMSRSDENARMFVKYLKQVGLFDGTTRSVYVDTDTRHPTLGTEGIFYGTLMNPSVMDSMGLPVWNLTGKATDPYRLDGFYMKSHLPRDDAGYVHMIDEQIREMGFDVSDYRNRVSLIGVHDLDVPHAMPISNLYWPIDHAPKREAIDDVLYETDGGQVGIQSIVAYDQKYFGKKHRIHLALYDAMLRMGTLDALEAQGFDVKEETQTILEDFRSVIAKIARSELRTHQLTSEERDAFKKQIESLSLSRAELRAESLEDVKRALFDLVPNFYREYSNGKVDFLPNIVLHHFEASGKNPVELSDENREAYYGWLVEALDFLTATDEFGIGLFTEETMVEFFNLSEEGRYLYFFEILDYLIASGSSIARGSLEDFVNLQFFNINKLNQMLIDQPQIIVEIFLKAAAGETGDLIREKVNHKYPEASLVFSAQFTGERALNDEYLEVKDRILSLVQTVQGVALEKPWSDFLNPLPSESEIETFLKVLIGKRPDDAKRFFLQYVKQQINEQPHSSLAAIAYFNRNSVISSDFDAIKQSVLSYAMMPLIAHNRSQKLFRIVAFLSFEIEESRAGNPFNFMKQGVFKEKFNEAHDDNGIRSELRDDQSLDRSPFRSLLSIVQSLSGVNIGEERRIATSQEVIQIGGHAFADMLENVMKTSAMPEHYQKVQDVLLENFRAKFGRRDLTFGVIFAENENAENYGFVKRIAEKIRSLNVPEIFFWGKRTNTKALRDVGLRIQQRKDTRQSILLADSNKKFPVSVLAENYDVAALNEMYLPIGADKLESIEDPFLREHIQFMQLLLTATTSALIQDNAELENNPVLLRGELIKALGPVLEEQIIAGTQRGLTLNTLAIDLYARMLVSEAIQKSA